MNKKLFVLLIVFTMISALFLAVGCDNNLDSGEDGSASSGDSSGGVSGDNHNQAHEHAYSQVFSSDRIYHWRDANCGHGLIVDKAEHSFDGDRICGVCGYCTTEGFVYELNSDKESYSVVGLEEGNDSSVLNIPNTYNGKPVVKIDSEAFLGCKNIVEAIIPSNITVIAPMAFSACDNLVKLTVDVDNAVFKSEGNCIIEKQNQRLIVGCKSSVIPDYVESITSSAFEGCAGLKSVKIPEKVSYIGFYAFKDCVSLETVEMPSQLKNLHSGAFRNCRALKSIDIPSGIGEISEFVFAGCVSLDSIEIPYGVTEIHSGAFSLCSSLKMVTIADSVSIIQPLAFAGCRAITFYCKGIEGTDKWDSVWNNDSPIVWDCDENEIADDGNIYFAADNGLRYALKDGNATLAIQSETLSGEVTIPDAISYKGNNYHVSVIELGAFRNCNRLTKIVIPSSVTNIGSYAFAGCKSLDICCAAGSAPDGWEIYWNSEDRPVVWGYVDAAI